MAVTHAVPAAHYVNTPWKQLFWAGYGLFWIGLLVWVRLIKPILLLRRPYAVEEVIQERGNAWTLALRPVGHVGMRSMPGQFAWLTAWRSPFADAEHPFSFSSGAGQPDRVTVTIKGLGDFTRTIKDLKPGQRVYLDGPFGAFSVDRHPWAQGYVESRAGFIVGGDLLLAEPSFEGMWGQVPRRFVDTLIRFGGLPSEIVVRRERLYLYLAPIAGQLGIKLSQSDRLPALDQVRRQFEHRM